MSEFVIHAEIELTRCTAELYVNGIPLRRKVHPGDRFASLSAHQYLISGDNRLELLIEPGPTPSRARAVEERTRAMPGSAAIARIVRYEEGGFANHEEGEVLAEVKWEGEADTRESFPKSVGKTVSLGSRPRWSFQDAPPLTLDDATRAEIHGVLDTVARAFARGDAAPVLRLLEPRFEEGIRAYPVNDRETLTRELTAYVNEVAHDGWKVRPLEPASFDFRLCAGDRLVELVDRDWLPSLRFFAPDEAEPYGYVMFLGRIEGRLAICR